ncbi:MAG: hypothetical protein FJZ64_00585 [Chlamydiae bacterium]|nr:hypothetical protein [Chlamydiota bacterium]
MTVASLTGSINHFGVTLRDFTYLTARVEHIKGLFARLLKELEDRIKFPPLEQQEYRTRLASLQRLIQKEQKEYSRLKGVKKRPDHFTPDKKILEVISDLFQECSDLNRSLQVRLSSEMTAREIAYFRAAMR